MGSKCHNPHFIVEEISSLMIFVFTTGKWQGPRSSVDPRLRGMRDVETSGELEDYKSLFANLPFRVSLKCSL